MVDPIEFINQNDEDKEINIKKLLATLFRQKKILLSITSLFLLFGTILAFSIKKTWEGQFQIVLATEEDSPNNTLNALISGNSGLSKILQKNNKGMLTTEVGILKSPSVLMPTFEFVKEKYKLTKGNDSLLFSDWFQNNLFIELEKGTSILNVTYYDKNKEFILPVLNSISKSYQKYSGKKRVRQITLGLNFLKDQISKYEERGKNSLSKIQKFASNNDIFFTPLPVLTSNNFENQGNLEVNPSLDIESSRVLAANKIKVLEEKIDKLEKTSNKNISHSFLTGFSRDFSQDSLVKGMTGTLTKIESELVVAKATYKDNDPYIINLIKQRDLINTNLKDYLINFLKAQKNESIAVMKSFTRDDGIINKYQQLMVDAQRDQVTLFNLENEYRLLSLEKFRTKDPWELITKPTIGDKPVAPRKRNILSFSLLLGLFVGSAIALIIEKYKDFIYSSDEINSLLKTEIIGDFSEFNNDKTVDNTLELLFNGTLANIKSDIALVSVGNIDKENLDEIKNKFSNFSKVKKVSLTFNITPDLKNADIILIIKKGLSKKNEIQTIRKKLIMLKSNLIGVLIV